MHFSSVDFPPPFGPKDRSAFLQALDQAVVRAKRVVR
jgi:uncharacterized protein YaiI (UPF0178 family)